MSQVSNHEDGAQGGGDGEAARRSSRQASQSLPLLKQNVEDIASEIEMLVMEGENLSRMSVENIKENAKKVKSMRKDYIKVSNDLITALNKISSLEESGETMTEIIQMNQLVRNHIKRINKHLDEEGGDRISDITSIASGKDKNLQQHDPGQVSPSQGMLNRLLVDSQTIQQEIDPELLNSTDSTPPINVIQPVQLTETNVSHNGQILVDASNAGQSSNVCVPLSGQVPSTNFRPGSIIQNHGYSSIAPILTTSQMATSNIAYFSFPNMSHSHTGQQQHLLHNNRPISSVPYLAAPDVKASPTSEFHNSNINVPMSTSHARPPAYPPNNGSESINVAQAITNHLRRSEVTKGHIQPFDGTPHLFLNWKENVERKMAGLDLSMGLKMSTLKSHCTGDVRKYLEELTSATGPLTQETFDQIFSKFTKRYGSKTKIASHLINKIKEVKPIVISKKTNIGSQLDEILNTCNLIDFNKSLCSQLIIFETDIGQNMILEKLPQELITRWRMESQQYRKSNDDNDPTFAFLISFLETVTDEYLNSTIVIESDKTTKNVRTVKTEVSNDKKPNQSKYCILHKNDSHSTQDCKDFPSLEYSEKTKLAKEKGLCYGCLEKHWKKFCPSKSRCEICSRKHLTIMHDPKRTIATANDSSAGNTEESSASSTTNASA